jgi:probable O-glycosylation ligase (exosortase A-associated)
MRSLAFFVEMLILLPMVTIQPFVGVLVWSWISFMSPHRLLWGPASGLPWAMITLAATLVGCVVAREPKRITWNPTTALILIFIICITLTSLTAMGPPDAVYAKWLGVVKAFSVMLLTAQLLTTKERIHAMVWIMALSLAYYGVKGGGFTVIFGGANRVQGPEGTAIGDNNALAAALLVCVPLMNYLRLQSQHRIIRIGLSAAMVLTLFSVVGSYSRGALIGLLAMSGFLWLKSKHKMLAAVVIPVLVGTVILFMPPEWMARMQTIDSNAPADNSVEGRYEIWHVAWVMAMRRPFTGSGFMGPYDDDVVNAFVPGATPRAVHSIWFEVLGEHGLVTFGVWLSISLSAVIASRRIIKSASGVPELEWCVDLAKMSQVSMVAYAVAGSFLSLSYWDYYFTMLVVVAATAQYVRAALGETTSVRSRQRVMLPSRHAVRGGAVAAKGRAGSTV